MEARVALMREMYVKMIADAEKWGLHEFVAEFKQFLEQTDEEIADFINTQPSDEENSDYSSHEEDSE